MSCITPTRNRAKYIKSVVASFLSQTYANKELIILDNGDDVTENLIPYDLSIKYSKIDGERSVGEMRNLCCELAKGELICHFDSDDWSAPDRVEDQVAKLLKFNMTAVGYRSMLFFEESKRRLYRWSDVDPYYALGTSLCYKRDWWENNKFLNKPFGEDFLFFKTIVRLNKRMVLSEDVRKMMVARVHDDQTVIKNCLGRKFAPMSRSELPKGFCEI